MNKKDKQTSVKKEMIFDRKDNEKVDLEIILIGRNKSNRHTKGQLVSESNELNKSVKSEKSEGNLLDRLEKRFKDNDLPSSEDDYYVDYMDYF